MNRPPHKATTVFLVASLLLGGPAGCDQEWLETTHSGVDDGSAALAAGRIDEAIAAFEEAATEVPESHALNYDRGLALSAAGRHDEATQMLLRSLEVDDGELRFRVYAALGLAYARWGLDIERSGGGTPAAPDDAGSDETAVDPAAAALSKWERAVDHLEKALALRADDQEVLRNLEVALLRVDPPCSSRNDEHEPNDTAAQAAKIELAAPEEPAQSTEPSGPQAIRDEEVWKRQLTACPDDADWFEVDLQPGDRLTAKLVAPSEAGRIGLSLHAAGGTPRLRPPAGDEIVLDTLDYSVGSTAAGPHLLRVTNIEGDEVSYSLDVTVRPACARTEDQFEDNDQPSHAALLTPGAIDNLKLCPLDEDWYAVVLAEGESLFAFVSLMEEEDSGKKAEPADDGTGAPPPPPIFLDFIGPDGAVVSKGAPTGQGRVATLLTPGEGTYRFRVSGEPGLEARYQLMLQVVGPCPDGDDQLEDNDSAIDAADFAAAAQQAAQAPGGGAGAAAPPGQGPPPPMLLRICPGDEDWLKFQAEPEAPVVISAVFEHAKGDLSLTLYDELGETELMKSDQSSPDANGEGVALPEVEVPTFYSLRVAGADPAAENFYLLRMDSPSGGGEDGESDEEEQEEQEEQPPEDEEQEQEQEEPEPEEQQPPQEEEQTPLEDALDKLDHNPQNLEAVRAQRSPLANHPPEKDW